MNPQKTHPSNSAIENISKDECCGNKYPSTLFYLSQYVQYTRISYFNIFNMII